MSMQTMSSAPARNNSRAAEIPSKVSLKSAGRLDNPKSAAPKTAGPASTGFNAAALKPGKIKI
jgi:hypothetical protein